MNQVSNLATTDRNIEPETLRELALAKGAHDAALISIDHPDLKEERTEILRNYPWARSLIPYVIRMNKSPLRAPARSLANLEFHHRGDQVNETGLQIAFELEQQGIRAGIGGAVGFPMEADRFPGRMWTVAHKTVAIAAGLGVMGINRMVIHPKFGNFILLGTVVTEQEIEAEPAKPHFNPCFECKLCVAACPVGAISSDGSFNFASCYTHNYREFMGGFSAYAENLADSSSRKDLRKKVRDSEHVSMWQSLSFGANYKAAYCMGVCPAGEDVIGEFQKDRKLYQQTYLKPVRDKVEPLYVTPGSDAEDYARKRFPHKELRPVDNGLNVADIAGFLRGMSITFQPGQSAGLDAVFHFEFTGAEVRKATVVIREGKITVDDGHQGAADFSLRVDSRTWVKFLSRDVGLLGFLLKGRPRVRGNPRFLLAFKRCFP